MYNVFNLDMRLYGTSSPFSSSNVPFIADVGKKARGGNMHLWE
jgi:hypothetical protein